MPINRGRIFIFLHFACIALIYYAFVIELYLPQYPSSKGILIGFHLIFFMLLWSLFHIIFSDPGRVPPYWRFYMGDSKVTRKSYCSICYVFQPERCYHCLVCNRCVLNMDDHCPWINNCVGFYNLKLNLLHLFYTLLSASYVILFMTPTIFSSVKLLTSSEIWVNLHPHLLYIGVYIFLNWLQVFGRNPWLWIVPYYGKSGKPVGDGVTWSLDHFQDVLKNDPVEPETNREGADLHPPNSLSVVDHNPSERPLLLDYSYEFTAEQNLNISRFIEQHKERITRSPFVSENNTEKSILSLNLMSDSKYVSLRN